MEYWGKKSSNGNLRPALIVSSFPDGCTKEIANVVYVRPDEILYPVPRSLFVLNPFLCKSMSNSQRNKMTTVLMEDTVVCVQIDSCSSEVDCMQKGGINMLALEKRGMGWMMEVDVAVSGEQRRQAFACSTVFPGTLVKTSLNLTSYVSNKPYKGTVKLNILYEIVKDWASKGISEFVRLQKHFKQANRSCFEFTLINLYETDEPNVSVVFDAPWQSVKRAIVLTPAQVGDGPTDDGTSLALSEPDKAATLIEKYLVAQGEAAETSVNSEDNKKDADQQLNNVPKLTDHSVKPISECLSTESLEQIKRLISGAHS